MTLTKKDYQELFNTLTPRMQKQLIEYAEMLDREREVLDRYSHNNEPEHGDFTIKDNTLFL